LIGFFYRPQQPLNIHLFCHATFAGSRFSMGAKLTRSSVKTGKSTVQIRPVAATAPAVVSTPVSLLLPRLEIRDWIGVPLPYRVVAPAPCVPTGFEAYHDPEHSLPSLPRSLVEDTFGRWRTLADLQDAKSVRSLTRRLMHVLVSHQMQMRVISEQERQTHYSSLPVGVFFGNPDDKKKCWRWDAETETVVHVASNLRVAASLPEFFARLSFEQMLVEGRNATQCELPPNLLRNGKLIALHLFLMQQGYDKDQVGYLLHFLGPRGAIAQLQELLREGCVQ
jgi:hypothetical protein